MLEIIMEHQEVLAEVAVAEITILQLLEEPALLVKAIMAEMVIVEQIAALADHKITEQQVAAVEPAVQDNQAFMYQMAAQDYTFLNLHLTEAQQVGLLAEAEAAVVLLTVLEMD
jgi:hypothetical protein